MSKQDGLSKNGTQHTSHLSSSLCIETLDSCHPGRTQYSSAKHTIAACKEQIALVQYVTKRVIRALDNVRLQILRYHSTLCTVNNLPTEILSYVFRLVAGNGAVCPTNLRVASVCSHWRTVSLHDPVVWSHFDATSTTNYIYLALLRSQSVPLSIIDSIHFNTPDRLVNLAKANLDRVRVLELRGGDKASLGVFSGKVFPLLNELVLTHDISTTHTLRVLHGFPITPKLRYLSFRDCTLNELTIDHLSMGFRGLTTLRIQIEERWALDGLLESILSLCQAAPGLERLLISSPSRYDPFNPIPREIPSREPVRMDHLRYFNLISPPSFFTHLLSSLVIQNPLCFLTDITGTKRLRSMQYFVGQIWAQTYLPAVAFADLQELEIRFRFWDSFSIDGSRHVELLNPDISSDVYIFYDLPRETEGRVSNYLAPAVSFILDTPMPKLKHLEVVQSRGRLPAGKINKKDVRKLTASIHRLLVGFPCLTSITLRLALAESLTGLRFRFPDISNSIAPVFPFLQKCTLQVGQAIRSSTIYTFVRQLCPVDIAELRFEGVDFEVRSPQEADEFARDDLSRLGRVVWVKGCSISVIGGGGPRSIASFWQEGEECPLRIDSGIVFEL